MSEALHVKYRPAKWEDVVGQDEVVKGLKKAVADKRAHTFMFTGPSGCGKTTLARITANAFANGQATIANIEEIDAASNSGVDDMRAVVTRALYKAIGASPIKAFIVDECHALSASAWKALLKPTEEPPAHVYWFLCSTEPAKIPKTILTRFLRYDLKSVDEETIAELLFKIDEAEKLGVSDPVIEAIAEDAGGSPRQALIYLEACTFCETAGQARSIMRTAGQSKEAIDLARFLLKPTGRNWQEAVKLLKDLEGTEAESIRIMVANYLASAMLGAKSDDAVKRLLGIYECFERPYVQTDRFAPLLKSVAMCLNLDR